MCTPTQGVWQPAGCVSCELVCVCVSLVRVVIICPASTHTALVSSPSLAVLHLSTYLPTCYNETNARRTWHIALGPTDIPHTRRPRARPTPAGRKGSDSLGRRQPEYVESWLNNAGFKRGWSGSQVRLTRLELNIYRTEHFRPLAPNPSTAAPRRFRELLASNEEGVSTRTEAGISSTK